MIPNEILQWIILIFAVYRLGQVIQVIRAYERGLDEIIKDLRGEPPNMNAKFDKIEVPEGY